MSMMYDLVVSEQYKKDGQDQTTYTRVGQAWPLDSGKGFSLVIRENLTVGGRLAMLPSKDESGNRFTIPEVDLVRQTLAVSEKGKSKEGGDKTYYTRVGMMFPLESKKGFSLVLRDHIAVSNGFAAFKPSPIDAKSATVRDAPNFDDIDDDIPF
ncbi:MAG: hypothetical protein AAGI44_00065 [Pseudomonadota bacterium]